jgi:hypothetical protein
MFLLPQPPISTISATTYSETLLITSTPSSHTLHLFCGDTVTFPTKRPSIRTLVRQIKGLGYLIEVHPYPNNDINLYPNKGWIIVVRIGDTSLRIIPFPFKKFTRKTPSD